MESNVIKYRASGRLWCFKGSNRQGSSLTVRDLIAMSGVRDCLSGALLFVREVSQAAIIL